MMRSSANAAVRVDRRELVVQSQPHLADVGIPYVVAGMHGQILHQSADAQRMMSDSGLAAQIGEAVRRIAAQQRPHRVGQTLHAQLGGVRAVSRCNRWPSAEMLVALWPCDDPAPPLTVASEDLLTAREREVASLTASALSTKEVAAALRISTHTARRHLENVHRKLGVHSRTELVLAMWADAAARSSREVEGVIPTLLPAHHIPRHEHAPLTAPLLHRERYGPGSADPPLLSCEE